MVSINGNNWGWISEEKLIPTQRNATLKSNLYGIDYGKSSGVIDITEPLHSAINNVLAEHGSYSVDYWFENNSSRVIFLITDSNVSVRSIPTGLNVYVIDLDGKCAENPDLVRITGGGSKIYKAVYSKEVETTRYIIDDTNTDIDRIPDVYDEIGVRTQDGTIKQTDPLNPDTDGNGILDGEEVVFASRREHSSPYLFNLNPQGEYYFYDMVSDPMKNDSDGDGYGDYE